MSAIIRLSLICVVLVVAVVSARNVQIQSGGVQKLKDITVVKDIRNFSDKHPGMKIIPLTRQESSARSQSIRYTIGGRVGDDVLVAQGTNSIDYPAANDVSLQLTYPETGTGSIVTFVEIIANQDNDQGNAYVVAGGIGQRFISIIIEAQDTEYFSYTAQFFGAD